MRSQSRRANGGKAIRLGRLLCVVIFDERKRWANLRDLRKTPAIHFRPPFRLIQKTSSGLQNLPATTPPAAPLHWELRRVFSFVLFLLSLLRLSLPLLLLLVFSLFT